MPGKSRKPFGFLFKKKKMGVCQSVPAAPIVESKGVPSGTPLKDVAGKRNDLSVVTKENAVTPENVHHVKPGYSSGASTDTETAGLSPSQHGHRKESSDVLGEIVKSLKADGTLQETVVRIETPFGQPIEDFYDGVHTGPVLGSGVSGIVRLVTHKATGVKYAVKCLDLGLITNETGLERLRDEIYIMCQLDHPNIVRLEEVYESINEIYLVQELCLGGDLFDRVDEQPDYHYTEAQCARLVKQMLSSVRYLHSKKIIHRDLKLENFLFSTQEPESELKMIDFGLSKHFQLGEMQHEAVGTPYTVAPEVIRGSYDERCDLWAIGVITYLLLSGETPFGGCDGENLFQVRDNILRGSFSFQPTDVWCRVSDMAKDFVKKLLVVDPHQRPTAKQAQKDPWIQHCTHNGNGNGNVLNPNVVKALVSFKEYSDMRKLMCEVLSFTLLPEQILDLRSEFEKLDINSDGVISFSAFKQVLLDNAEAGALGALTEEEVEDIFNALRVRKTETTIQWHEFIAGSLSQCQVDDRNLQLAFDRLDTDRKGYITFENVMELVGSDASHNKVELRDMWVNSLAECKGDAERITYEDFLMLMKGQTAEADISTASPRQGSFRKSRLSSVLEDKRMRGDEIEVACARTQEDYMSSEEFALPLTVLGSPAESWPQGYYSFRHRSLEQNIIDDLCEDDEEEKPKRLFTADSTRAILLPVHHGRSVGALVHDPCKSPLVVNKSLYRAHREMRLAVLEASKRFEEKRAERSAGAGLIMRRGSMPPRREEMHEQEVMNRARRRGGRTRKYKTASDLTGMMGTPSPMKSSEGQGNQKTASALRSSRNSFPREEK